MDSSYSLKQNNRRFLLPVVIVLVVFISGIGFLIIKSKSRLISPLPDEPAVEIIFYTPTPQMRTPTSSPSATPKTAVRQPSPTKKTEVTPTGKATATVTKAEASATPKP
ncbi:hypothetical protein A3D78_06440 [Candidatus Gottesmanbacteria bacterium RIFCSPHIGHO2_02_FULL_39_14]|uniref:Uncharacterized protein n=1 Tax=Candidatus Gottesmanbacteria bacterium RIFCSPHIGHO2_02_FULL_39_14 TaxID=1798383 RepID=A0A1F5ZWS8_9BACT|nr:MAG: hypothetical protein A3D78_06440 [Candidatus Gottesmanbacteria bacterium RIFCSPHIGHO2_02_FULL_39_14]